MTQIILNDSNIGIRGQKLVSLALDRNELINRRALWLRAPRDATDDAEEDEQQSDEESTAKGLVAKYDEYGIGSSELLYAASNAMLDAVKARTPSLTFLDVGGIGIGPSCAERLADLLNVRALLCDDVESPAKDTRLTNETSNPTAGILSAHAPQCVAQCDRRRWLRRAYALCGTSAVHVRASS